MGTSAIVVVSSATNTVLGGYEFKLSTRAVFKFENLTTTKSTYMISDVLTWTASIYVHRAVGWYSTIRTGQFVD